MSAPTSPAVPQDATIAHLVVADGVGTLSLVDGSTLRFGASVCRGFSPAVGLRVRVTAIKPHPLHGFAAGALVLASPATEYDALVRARDVAAGIAGEVDPVQAAHTSLTLGWIVVLLDEPVPSGPQAFVEWAERLGLPAHGIRAEAPPMARLALGSVAPLVYAGSLPIPDRLLESFVSITPAMRAARGFVGLSLGLPGTAPVLRIVTGGVDDPWGPHGRLRDLSRLAERLAMHGPGVILPQGHFGLPRDAFLRRLGDLDDASNRPFLAWVGLSKSPEERRWRSVGMGALELLNATCIADGEGSLADERARAAVLAACHRMVRESRSLEAGTTVDVPIGIPLATSAPIDATGVDTEPYRVEDADGELALRPLAPSGALAQRWAAQGASIAPTTYEALLRAAAADWHRGCFVANLTMPAQPGAPEMFVEVHRIEGGAVLHTVGAGRTTQPGGDREDGTLHVELVAAVPQDHPLLERLLGVVAQAMHAHPADRPYRFGDTITLQVPEIEAEGFLLLYVGSLSLGAGEPISIAELVPLAAHELDRCRREGSAGLAHELGPFSIATRGPRYQLRSS